MRAFAVCCVLLAGCTEISGLDGLSVGDATIDSPAADATGDVAEAVDAADASDAARADASDASDAKPPSDASPPTDAGGDSTTGPCTAPADCKSGQVCCETLITTGSFNPCKVDADTIACTSSAQCSTNIPFACGKEVLRRCAANADCTESSYPKCCTMDAGGVPREVCLSATLAQLLVAPCL